MINAILARERPRESAYDTSCDRPTLRRRFACLRPCGNIERQCGRITKRQRQFLTQGAAFYTSTHIFAASQVTESHLSQLFSGPFSALSGVSCWTSPTLHLNLAGTSSRNF